MTKRGYTGKEMLNSEFKEPPKLIERLLWEGDNVIVLGGAKTGKSLYALQVQCALTTGLPLFDQFRVFKKCNVLNVQAEGKMSESCVRYKRMSKEIDSDPERIRWLHVPHIPMDRDDSARKFIQMVKEEFDRFRPDVIIFDPLYMLASTGSLTQDDVAGAIVANLNKVKLYFDATIILNHHEHRPKMKDDFSGYINEGDNSIFGSFIWKAWPDHILHWKKLNKHNRELSCNTQRSGEVVENTKLFFNEPDPLYFEINEEDTDSQHIIFKIIEKEKEIEISDLPELLPIEMAQSTVYKSLRRLCKQGKIKKLDKRGRYGII